MTKAEAGRMGGKSTVARYGKEHMRAIGRKGALALWEAYNIQVYGTSGYCLVHKQTNRIVAIWNERPGWMTR